jgi:thiamine-monophosphate kinase
MSGEFELIEWIRARSRGSDAVPLGIGDDAAVLRAPRGDLLVTTDLLMEGTHFDLSVASPRDVGRKCLAVNLSDIAAMAGRPLAAFVSVALPRAGGRALAEDLYAGMWPLAEQHGVVIAGGDTNSWDGPLVVNVCVVGKPMGKGPVTRTGAQPGDWLLVTGPLGGSLSGRHLRFMPRVREALALHEAVALHAMLDLSDGVASDVRHLLRGELGCVIDGAAVPIHPDVDAPVGVHASACPAASTDSSRLQGLNPESTPGAGSLKAELQQGERLHRALCDGEDFELLLAVSPEDGARLLANPPVGVSLWRIGEVTTDGRRLLREVDGSVHPLMPGGWEHRVS